MNLPAFDEQASDPQLAGEGEVRQGVTAASATADGATGPFLRASPSVADAMQRFDETAPVRSPYSSSPPPPLAVVAAQGAATATRIAPPPLQQQQQQQPRKPSPSPLPRVQRVYASEVPPSNGDRMAGNSGTSAEQEGQSSDSTVEELHDAARSTQRRNSRHTDPHDDDERRPSQRAHTSGRHGGSGHNNGHHSRSRRGSRHAGHTDSDDAEDEHGARSRRRHHTTAAAAPSRMRRPSGGVPRFGRPFASTIDVVGASHAVSGAAIAAAVASDRQQQQRDALASPVSRSGQSDSLTLNQTVARHNEPTEGDGPARPEERSGWRSGEAHHTTRKPTHRNPVADDLDDNAAAPDGLHHSRHVHYRGTGGSAGSPRDFDERERHGRASRAAGGGKGRSVSSRSRASGSAASSSHSDSGTASSAEGSILTRDSFGNTAYHPVFRQGTVFSEYDAMVHSPAGANSKTATRQASFVLKGMSASGSGNAPTSPQQQQRGGEGNNGAGRGPGAAASLHVPTTTDVPWDLRNMTDQEVKTFAFLSTRYFWFLIEYALRVTLIAMLVPAAIINMNIEVMPFVSPTFALTSVVIATGTTFGQTSLFFVQYTKAGMIWLPLATICVALKLNQYLAAWFVVYVVLLFLMALFTEKTTRRMCLLLYNICMVNLLSGDGDLVYPSRALADWAMGAAFALVATLIPYPLLATRLSANITKTMFKNTATCFTGILSCFWAPSNTERSMSMVRIRSLVRTLDQLIEKFDANDAFTFYEVLIYETSERREVRREKVKLLLKLKMNLRAMERVINMVQERPQMIDQSERCSLLRDHLSVPMDDISRSMEALLWSLSAAKRYDDLRALSGYFEATGRAIKRLQNEFDVGRRVLFYEHQDAKTLQDGRMEEFVPLMTFFVFSIVNFWTTLEEFEVFIDRHQPIDDWKQTFQLVWNAILEPFVENVELVRLLLVRRAEPEVRVLIEAAKVSVAMLISVIFFYYLDDQNLLLSGPTIIAFVSGTNPVEAVQAGAARMSGTMIGSVLGFFAATLCKTAVDRVAALCVITFVMTFFRPGQKFGVICMYCNFVAVSSLAPTEQSADDTISRIQQNTFSIFIYCFISVTVFPVSPNALLFQKRMAVIQSLNNIVQNLTELFNDAAHSYTEARAAMKRGSRTEDDVISITTANLSSFHRVGNVPIPATLAQPVSNNNNNDSDVMFRTTMSGGNFAAAGPRQPRGLRAEPSLALHGAFTMAPEDTVVDKIFVDIFAMLDVMKATSSVMPLAADEFQIIPHEYPLRASGDVHAALYRLCALVYTMTCSWKTMREKGYFTSDMLHILHNLAPIANDIGRCLERFTHVMDFYIRFPSSGLSSELTKGAMQFRALCVELSARKERDLIAVIQQTIREKRIRDCDDEEDEEDEGDGDDGCPGGSGSGSGGGGNGSGSTTGSGPGGADGRHTTQHRQQRRQHRGGHSERPRKRGRDSRRARNGRRRGSGASTRRGTRQNTRDDVADAGTPNAADGQRTKTGESAAGARFGMLGVAGISADAPLFDPSLGYRGNMASATGVFASGGSGGGGEAGTRTGHSFCSPLASSHSHEHSGGGGVGSSQDRSDPASRSLPAAAATLPGPATAWGGGVGRGAADARVPGFSDDGEYLPRPRDETPAMPRGRADAGAGNGRRSNSSSDEDAGSASTASPGSHQDGGAGLMSNTTRIFDSRAFPPPPPPDDEAATAQWRARYGGGRQEGYDRGLSGGFVVDDSAQDDAKAERRADTRYGDGSAAVAPSTWERVPPHEGRRSERSRAKRQTPERLVAHEEFPPVRRSSVELRADRLRSNVREMQRQASSGVLTRHQSSAEMRSFVASYTNTAALGASMSGQSNSISNGGSGGHHQSHHRNGGHATHHGHHHTSRSRSSPQQQQQQRRRPHSTGPSYGSSYHDDEEGNNRRQGSNSEVSSGGLDGSVPYGSRGGDLALLTTANPADFSSHDPTATSPGEPLTADGVYRGSPRGAGNGGGAGVPASLRPGSPECRRTPARQYSADRITLDQSSTTDDSAAEDKADHHDGDPLHGDGEHRRHGAADGDSDGSSYDSSAASSHSGSDTDSSDRYSKCSYRGSGGDGESDSEASASLVRFGDSFSTPITVLDAEGLHSFTLSLEMFGKELRRVLYGLEEMLQSL